MTDKKSAKRKKFAHEILGLIGISALAAVVLFLILTNIAVTVAEVYCFENDVPMTEFDWMEVDLWISGVGAVLSVSLFCILFLTQLADRLAYIRKITKGIEAMRTDENQSAIPLEGNNELTALADAINYMADARQQLRQKEQALAQEKDQLVRTLSHDIRTPLTSILAYSDFLAEENSLSAGEQKNHLRLIRKKAEQIRELTDILLDGGKRAPEHFENGRLLMEQLAEEFAEGLEDSFTILLDLSGCRPFDGDFDVGELRRIFDNLGSNVRKYAQASQPVRLSISLEDSLIIWQSNAAGNETCREDSYRLGINSIRRIAQHYGGTVSVTQSAEDFAITVTLSDF